MNTRDLLKLLLLATIWGASFLLIRIAAPALGPAGLVTARMLIAGVALVLFAVATHRTLPSLRDEWRTFLALGALNSAVPLMLEAFALLHLSASLGAILASTTPLWTAVSAALWLGERLTARAAVGLALGMTGVVAIVGWSELALTGVVILAVGAVLLSALLYSLGGIYARAVVRGRSPLALTIGQELSAGVLLLPLALAAPPPGPLSLPVAVATVTLALAVTAGGTLLYFDLLARLGPTRTQSVGFLVPGVTLLLGVLLLGEPLTAGTLLGLGLVLASVGLVAGRGHVTGRQPVARRLWPGAADDAGPARVILAPPAVPSEPQLASQRLGYTAAGYDRQSTRRDRMRSPTPPVGVGL
jgi:drug/metabolite transporter (DMT)-like permease